MIPDWSTGMVINAIFSLTSVWVSLPFMTLQFPLTVVHPVNEELLKASYTFIVLEKATSGTHNTARIRNTFTIFIL
jgi:hypothetical protein